MKRALLVGMGIAGILLACAGWGDNYPPTLDDVITSAPAPSGSTLVWMLASDNQTGEPSAGKLFCSVNGQASYTPLDMTEKAGIWQAAIPNPAAGLVYFYVAARDSAVSDQPATWATQSPFIAADAMPPATALLANAAEESSGDMPYDPTAQGYDTSHDLTGFAVGYSAARIYTRMTTVAGDFPTNSGGIFPTYYYGYTVGVVNPDSPYTGEYTYALVYASIPLLVSPGLYRIDIAGQSLTRIGDIQYKIAGGALTMSCAVADLTNDPYFGAANPSGYYMMVATTEGGTLASQQMWPYDVAGPCNHYRQTPSYTIGVNSPPVLSEPVLTPSEGEAGSTVFRYQVTYTDADNHLPVSIKVYIAPDSVNFTGHDLTSTDRGFADGSMHRFYTRLGYGPAYSYYFEASDGMATVRLPAAGAYSGPLVGVTSVSPAGWINPGWNLFSVPLQAFDPNAASIFAPENVANRLFAWDPVRKTFILFPDDFSDLDCGRGYLLLSDKNMQPKAFGAPATGTFSVAVPSAGWMAIGDPQLTTVLLSSLSVMNNGTGEVRTANEDQSAAHPWLNWNLVYLDSTAETAKLCSLSAGDDDRLRPWYGYWLWSNTGNLTLLVPQ
jgi:hypothetical protein